MLIGGGDLDESKSTSGYVFNLGRGAISWCSKKQDCIALSTMDVEYVACCLATHEVIWLRSFLQDLNPTPKVDDLKFAKVLKFHRKTKHIKRCYHFVRNIIKDKDMFLQVE